MVSSRRAVQRFHSQIPVEVREELAMEAVTRTLEARQMRSPPGFARRVARNLAIDWLRARREVLVERELADPREPSVIAQLDAERAVSLLARAPRSYRTTLQALFLAEIEVDDLVASECGEREELTEAAWGQARDRVYKRRARGLRWLRTHLEAA
jgi:DNA-directed RNA polymerase specialized sigma24 family protein